MVHGATPSKYRFLRQYLVDDAAEAPDISWRGVGLRTEQDFRRSVPASCHAFREHCCEVFEGERADQSEVAEFDGAVGVDEDVAGLEIPVDDLAGVQVLEGLGHLVDDEPDVDVLQDPLSDDVVQVCLHVLEQQIDVLIIIGPDGVVQLDDVWVVQLPQDLDLSVGALRIGGVLEGVEDLLEREHLLRRLLLHLPHVSVGTGAHLLQDAETAQDVRLEVVCVGLRRHSCV